MPARRADLAFATGFAHGQDRYFQMDLMRRAAAGEMAELLGASVLDMDRKLRVHGFRRVAREIVAAASDNDRALPDAYAAGVNFALSQAAAKPWEYLLLGAKPAPWLPEDSMLAAFSMYLNLNDSSGSDELARLQLHDALPPALFAFISPLGTEWDAPTLRWNDSLREEGAITVDATGRLRATSSGFPVLDAVVADLAA